MNIQHKELAAGRWQKMPLVEQMANIGSEVERALNWKLKNNADYSLKAFDRALELLDLTLEHTKNFSSLKELARTREALVDYFIGVNEYASSEKLWRQFFMDFAVAARQNR